MLFDLKRENVTAIHTAAEDAVVDGKKALRVVKAEKLMEFDENTYAKLDGTRFHNGTIELKMLSRLLPDAPDFARGFIGIAFRIDENDSSFESFYVRPTNGRIDDPVRRNRGCQYFSYPKYTFGYFRDNGITDYEAPADVGLNEWMELKAVVKGERADFYINGVLVLSVRDMKRGSEQIGSVGLFVDIGTEAFFRDIEITEAP